MLRLSNLLKAIQLLQWQFQILTVWYRYLKLLSSVVHCMNQNTRNTCRQLHGDGGKNTQEYILNTIVFSSKPVYSSKLSENIT